MSKYFKKFGHNCNLQSENDKKFHELIESKGVFKKLLILWTVANTALINDKSHLKSYASIVNERLYHAEHYLGVIHPYSKFKALWEVYIAIVILAGLFTKPFKFLLYFDHDLTNDIGNIPLIFFVNVSCIVDIFVRFNVAYYDKKLGKVIFDRYHIAWKYITRMFILDLIMNVPFLTVAILEMSIGTINRQYHWVRVMSLLRIFRLFTMIRYFKRFLERFRFDEKILAVCFLFLCWAVFIHWTSCLILLPVVIESKFDVIHHPQYEAFVNLPLHQKYFSCLYTTVKTIAGLDFKFYDKVSLGLQSFSLIIVIAGRLGLIITFGLMFNLFKGYRSASLRYEEMMTQIDIYAKHNKIPESTKEKLKANCQHKFRRKFFNVGQILETVSPTLRQEILLTSASRLVKNSPFFANLPKSLIFRVVSSLQHQVFLKNDIIYTIDSDALSIYFIITGTVAFFSPSGKEICHFKDGDYFGEICLLSNKEKRMCSAVALETTECFTFRNDEFQKLIASYPDLGSQVQALAVERVEMIMVVEERYSSVKTRKKNNEQMNQQHEIRARTTRRQIYFEH